jgi:hypothetical protein
VRVHEDVWGFGGIPSRILDLGTRWRCVVSFMPHYTKNKADVPIGYEGR